MLHAAIDKIRRLAVISLFHDDSLLDMFVLKGGNALNLVYGFSNRASVDIDVSMEKEFTEDELQEVESRLFNSFNSIFGEEEFSVFDFKLYPTPQKVRPEYSSFWGGYTVEFKVIEKRLFETLDEQRRRLQAAVIGEGQQKKFTIDISKYEYVEPKELAELDGYSIYVYSPIMVIYEKLRAICQQMVEYGEYVKSNRRPRAKDFYDIYTIIEGWKSPIDIYTNHNINMLREIFSIKHVPLSFLGNIVNQRDFHRDDFNSVRDTVSEKIESYDFYFDYVVDKIKPFEPIWQESSNQIAASTEQHLDD